MPLLTETDILCVPFEDNPGWLPWTLRDEAQFNNSVMGGTIIRREGDRSRIRMVPERRHSNMFDGVHGGIILSLVDIALFPTLYLLSEEHDKAAAFNSVTVEASTQFIGAARIDEPLDAIGELMHQTGRMAFLRGTVEQGETLVASWSGLVRKPARR